MDCAGSARIGVRTARRLNLRQARVRACLPTLHIIPHQARSSGMATAICAHPQLPGTSVNDPGEATWRGLSLVVQAVVVLNLLDAVLTLFWVNTGIATEANVLLAELVESNAVLFMAVKLALVSAGMWLLWRHRERPLAVFGMLLAFLTYNTLLLYHLRIAVFAVENAFV